MATLNSTIKPAHYPLADVARAYRDQSYVVDDTFQRRLVWTPKQKVRLIETILKGYPMPEIYLHQMEADAEGRQQFSIVDGQQRITTVVQFVSNEWPLDAKFLDKDNRQSEYANCKWDNLSDEIKKTFWAYTINSRVIPPDVTKDEIKAIFRRLNESDKSLNPQELRHAEFSGRVIKLAEYIADLDFWNEWAIFTPNSIRRMVDVETATSLISYLRNGIVTDSPETINALYDLYNEKYPSEVGDKKKIKQFLELLDDLFDRSDDVWAFFSKPVHIYTLFTVFDAGITVRFKRKLADAMKKFAKLYSSGRTPTGKYGALIASYREGAVQRTRSRGSRLLRHDALLNFLKSEGL